jgi:hypothetical protein
MVLTAYIALSPVTGLSCHRRLRSCLHRLDASVGASGPHDFAVRRSAPSSEALPTSTASRPAFVTIASRPSKGTGPNRYNAVSTWPSSGIRKFRNYVLECANPAAAARRFCRFGRDVTWPSRASEASTSLAGRIGTTRSCLWVNVMVHRPFSRKSLR